MHISTDVPPWEAALPKACVLLDTSAVVAPGFDAALIGLLRSAGRSEPVFLPRSVRSEVSSDLDRHVSEFRKSLKAEGLLTVKGSSSDATPHPAVLLREAVRQRLKHQVVIFTNDRERAHDLSLVGDQESYERDVRAVHVVSWDRELGFQQFAKTADDSPIRSVSWRDAIGDAASEALIDTNILMDRAAEPGFKIVTGALPAGKAMHAPYSAAKELKSLKNKRPEEVRRALGLAERLHEEGFLQWRGEKSDPRFLDNWLVQKVIELATEAPVVVFTNDRALQRDLLSINAMTSYAFKPVSVARFHGNGTVLDVPPEPVEGPGTSSRTAPDRRRFRYALFPRSSVQTQVSPSRRRAPRSGDAVSLASGEVLTLKEEIGSGGQGNVYSTSRSAVVAKIYRSDRRSLDTIEKTRLLQTYLDPPDRVAWPISEVLDEDGEQAGYVMKRITGSPIQLAVHKPLLLAKRHPSWTRVMLAQIARGVAEIVAQLHVAGIVIGDINASNFLVDETGGVFLVDIDSAQIEDLPCPVGTVAFTPPSMQGCDFATVLRTPEDDEFALATLIFTTLMVGKQPYARQGAEDMAQNMQQARFPYRFRDTVGEPPPGKWPFIWSNFPYEIKKAFTSVFRHDDRITAAEWVSILKRYEELISKGYSSGELFPTKYKPGPNGEPPRELLTCSACNGYFTGYSNDPKNIFAGKLLCRDHRLVERECRRCHDTFVTQAKGPRANFCPKCERLRGRSKCHECGEVITGFSEDVTTFQGHPYCRHCYKSRGSTLTCRTCGDTFVWTYSDQAFFATKDFVPPKDCKSCKNSR